VSDSTNVYMGFSSFKFSLSHWNIPPIFYSLNYRAPMQNTRVIYIVPDFKDNFKSFFEKIVI